MDGAPLWVAITFQLALLVPGMSAWFCSRAALAARFAINDNERSGSDLGGLRLGSLPVAASDHSCRHVFDRRDARHRWPKHRQCRGGPRILTISRNPVPTRQPLDALFDAWVGACVPKSGSIEPIIVAMSGGGDQGQTVGRGYRRPRTSASGRGCTRVFAVSRRFAWGGRCGVARPGREPSVPGQRACGSAGG